MAPSRALHSRDVRLCDADTLAETSKSSSGAESAQSATIRKCYSICERAGHTFTAWDVYMDGAFETVGF